MKKTIHALAILLMNTFSSHVIGHVRRREEFIENAHESSKEYRSWRAEDRDASSSMTSSNRQQYLHNDNVEKRALIIRHEAPSTDLLHKDGADSQLVSSREGLAHIESEEAPQSEGETRGFFTSEEDEDADIGFFPKGFAIFSGIGRGEETMPSKTNEDKPKSSSVFADSDPNASNTSSTTPLPLNETEELSDAENDTTIERPDAFLPVFPDNADSNPKDYSNSFKPVFYSGYDPNDQNKWNSIFVPVFETLSPSRSPSPSLQPSGVATLSPTQKPTSRIVETAIPTPSSTTGTTAPTLPTPLFTLAPTVLDAPTLRPTATLSPTEQTPLFTLMPTADTQDSPTIMPASPTTEPPKSPTLSPTITTPPDGEFSDSPSPVPSSNDSGGTVMPTGSLPLFTFAPTGIGSEDSAAPSVPTESSNSPSVSVTSSVSSPPTTALDGPTLFPSVPPSFTTAPSLSTVPSAVPTITAAPTLTTPPSNRPSIQPSVAGSPSAAPSMTFAPSGIPTIPDSLAPTGAPSIALSGSPTVFPTTAPTVGPTAAPSLTPTVSPTIGPTLVPSPAPTTSPTALPTQTPSSSPVVSVARREGQLYGQPAASSAEMASLHQCCIIGLTAVLILAYL